MHGEAREIALAGMLAALGAVLLCLGTLVPLATYAAPVLASAAVLIAREECRAGPAFGCYAVSAALGLLLSPDREAALLYAFLGYYPLLKPKLDALRPRPLRALAKLLLCCAAVGAMYALLIFVFRLEAVVREAAETTPALLAATVALGVVVFLVYDLALVRLTIVYQKRRARR